MTVPARIWSTDSVGALQRYFAGLSKMRNLLGSYPQVASRLATQPTGHFFVLTTGRAAKVRCDRSLMQIEQMSEAKLLELARRR